MDRVSFHFLAPIWTRAYTFQSAVSKAGCAGWYDLQSLTFPRRPHVPYGTWGANYVYS